MQTVSFFTSNKRQTANATLTVGELVNLIQSGAKSLSDTIKQARAVFDPSNKEAYDAIKSKLPAFVPHRFDGIGRKLENLTSYSGIVILDLDGLTTREAENVRDTIFSKSEHCLLAFLSPSGRGVKALILTDATDKAKAHDTFKAVTDYFAPLVSELLGKAVPFDPSGKDAPRLCYLSFDPQLYFNADAVKFAIRYPDKVPKPSKVERTVHAETLCEYAFIQYKAEQYLKEKGFAPTEGSGRHSILTQLAGYLNAGGVNPIVAENIFRDALATYGLSTEYIESKISTVLHSIYSQYAEQFGTATLTALREKERRIVHVIRYLTERADVITETFSTPKRWLVLSPTGAGKSTAYLKTARTLELTEKDYIVYLTPNRDTAINLYETNDADALAVSGYAWRKELERVEHTNARLIIGVIDNLAEIQHTVTKAGGRIHTLIVDESHKVEADVTFRNGAVSQISRAFHDPKLNFIAITATPTPFMERIFEEVIAFVPAQRQTVNAYVERWFDLNYIGDKAIESVAKGRKGLIRVASKAQGEYLKAYFAKAGKTVEFINANTKDTDYHKAIIEKGRFGYDLLITTKILEDGFSINDDTTIDCFYIFGNNEPLSPIPVRQFSARPRKQSETDTYIYYTPRNAYGSKEKDHLKAETYFTQHIQAELAGFTYDPEKDSFSARTVCNSAKKRINKDKSVHIFGLLNNATRKYYGARANELETELRNYFDTLTDLDDYRFDPERVERIKQDMKAIRKERNEATKQLLHDCKNESFFTALAGGYGKDMQLHSINEPTDKNVCRTLCSADGWTHERILKTDFQKVLRRIDLLRTKEMNHRRAVELVAENWNSLRWYQFMVQLGEYERLEREKEGKATNNAVTEYDKAKELELVGLIETFANGRGTFTLAMLMEYLKSIGYALFHIAKDNLPVPEKVALILRAYFEVTHTHTRKANYWQIHSRHTADTLRELLYGEGATISNMTTIPTLSHGREPVPITPLDGLEPPLNSFIPSENARKRRFIDS
jgi:hypothetical protein